MIKLNTYTYRQLINKLLSIIANKYKVSLYIENLSNEFLIVTHCREICRINNQYYFKTYKQFIDLILKYPICFFVDYSIFVQYSVKNELGANTIEQLLIACDLY